MYIDKLVAWNPLNFNLLIASPEVLIDQKNFYLTFHKLFSQYFTAWVLIAVRQEINNLDSSVVVLQFELAINLA